jgi:hypothetical protein
MADSDQSTFSQGCPLSYSFFLLHFLHRLLADSLSNWSTQRRPKDAQEFRRINCICSHLAANEKAIAQQNDIITKLQAEHAQQFKTLTTTLAETQTQESTAKTQ